MMSQSLLKSGRVGRVCLGWLYEQAIRVVAIPS